MTAIDTWEQSFAAWETALYHKDVAGLIALYAPDARIYDAIPPFDSDVDAFAVKLQECFTCMPEALQLETRERRVHRSDGLVSVHFVWHFTGLPAHHPAGRYWLRSSLVWQQQPDGAWRIIHEHCSAPFNPWTETVEPDPDALLAPPDGLGGNPVCWFEIHVADMARARRFYETVFACSLEPLSPAGGNVPELWAFPARTMAPGCGGALAHMPGRSPGGSTLVYFSCRDCAVEAERAVAAGGSVVRPRFSIGPHGYIALVTDSEGNMIGLHSLQ